MHVVVCIKPSIESSRITYDPRSGAPIRPVDVRVSERDAVALQAALDIKERQGARVTTLSIGDETAGSLLEQTLRAGADRAVRLWHQDDGEPLDTWAAATAGATAVTTLGADLVICAAHSDDLASEFFPAALAAAAQFDLGSRVLSLTLDDGALELVQKLEGGWRARHRIRIPAVIAVENDLTRARHHAVLGRIYRAGLMRQVEVWTPDTVGLAGLPLPLVREMELALPRPRTRVAAPQTSRVSAKDRLRRKKTPAGPQSTQEVLAGAPDHVARQLLERFAKWLA